MRRPWQAIFRKSHLARAASTGKVTWKLLLLILLLLILAGAAGVTEGMFGAPILQLAGNIAWDVKVL